MKIIEFFGLPYSGKTYYANYCEKFFKNKKKIYDNNSIFFRYLLKKKKISYLYYSIILFKYLSLKKRFKKKNITKTTKIIKRNNKKKNFLYKEFFFLNREKYKLFRLSKKKYVNFYELCTELIRLEDSFYRRKKLHRWLIDELNGYFLAKSNEISGLMIVSESFIQRIHSYFLSRDQLDVMAVKKYLNFMPDSDFIFYVKIDIKIIKERLKLNISSKKEKFYFEHIENLDKKMKIIHKEILVEREVNTISKIDSLKEIITNQNFNYND